MEDKDCFAGQARQHHLADHGSGLSDLGSLGGWKMTVSWTKSYHEDGRFVRQEHGGWSTGWVNFYERYKSPSDVPAIWKDFGDKPFEESAVSLPISNFPKDLPCGLERGCARYDQGQRVHLNTALRRFDDAGKPRSAFFHPKGANRLGIEYVSRFVILIRI